MKMLIITSVAVVAMLSCKKEGLPDPPPCTHCNTDTLMIWKHDLDTLTGEESLFADPILYNGNPVFAIHDSWDCNFGSANRITCIDAATGKKLWGFDLDDPCISLFHHMHIFQDVIALNTYNSIQAFNIPSGTKRWEISFPGTPYKNGSGAYGIGNKFYLEVFTGAASSRQTSALWELDMVSGQSRSLIEYKVEESPGNPVFNPPALWINPLNGDSTLLFTVAFFNSLNGPLNSTFSLCAYNLNQSKLIWKIDSLGLPANMDRRVEVYDNKVYVLTDYRMQCFDAFDGTKLWEYVLNKYTQYVSSFAFSRPLAIKGKVIVNPTGDDMYCLDANTGNLIWSIPEYTASANNDIIEHNGVIYLSSGGYGRFIGVDLESGKIVLNLRSPNKSTHFAGYNVVLNKEKNLLFLNDFKSAFAYRPVR